MNGKRTTLTRRAAKAAAALLIAGGLTTTAGPLRLAGAATLVVTSGADSGPGTLRQAVADAAAGDTITFAVGTVTLTSGQVTIGKNLTIRGNGPAQTTVTRSSANRFRIFEVPAGADVTLDLLTVTGGDEVFGGGLRNLGRLTVSRSVVTGNRGAVGAGINNNGGELSVLNSAIDANLVDNRDQSYGSFGGEGAGISSFDGGSVLVRDSQVVGNTVLATIGGSGAGIDTNTTPLTLIDSLVASNTARQLAGGIFMDEGTIVGSVIRGNSAMVAGGASLGGAVTIERTEFSDNRADVHAGAILANSGESTLTNVTLSGNTAPAAAGLLVGWRSVVHLRSSTVAANSTADAAALETEVTRISGGWRSGRSRCKSRSPGRRPPGRTAPPTRTAPPSGTPGTT